MTTIEKIFLCSECEDTGEVSVPAPVWPGEPHVADIEVQPCICTIDAGDYE